ncbi:hypothetical protein [uncultured Pontibacter sp.]|uniref:hypothetical protein n=1 Tax=uncultured Pontibacter sp. TaxID=453356 RepID=UPI00262609A6|nr:hypothetical protein [uncultured Pontibacter sp.]
MKRYTWLLLLISALAEPMGHTGIYMAFRANRSYIATFLCEQRIQPTSECKGACYLKKELEKETERKQQAHNQHASPDIILMATTIKVAPQELAYVEKAKSILCSYGLYPLITHSIFHPPQYLT